MKKFLKWLAIGIASIFGLLLAVGLLFSGDKNETGKVSSTAPVANKKQAQPSSAPVKQYAADQCLDGVCIGMTAEELSSQKWIEKVVTPDRDITQTQRELLDYVTETSTKKCLSRQGDAWGSRVNEMCKLLANGVENEGGDAYRPIQVGKVLAFFAHQKTPVCEFFEKEPVSVRGMIASDSGDTRVRLHFDASGILRVYSINKVFDTLGQQVNVSLLEKLKAKHPYVAMGDSSNDGVESLTGTAPWGGEVSIKSARDSAPTVVMTANKQDFDSSQLAACRGIKDVSVK